MVSLERKINVIKDEKKDAYRQEKSKRAVCSIYKEL